MENLVFQDTGVYRCGIATSGKSLVFDVQLQVSDEPVSVPLLRFSPLTRGSSCGNYVSVFCEPVHGSLPIQYSWYEKTPSGDSKISDNKKMDLHCQSLKYNNYLYYCNVSNGNGTKSSEMIRVSTSNNVRNCRYVIEVNRMGKIHFCENTVTESMTTAQREKTTSPQISISPSVSGDLWAEDKVRGVVGRAVTIDCHYAPMYRSHTKYFCHMRGHQCTSLVNTNEQTEQSGRMTIRDKTSQGIFTVTMENLVFQDTGVYRCGIATSGKTLVFDVYLQVSDEPVSVPLLRFSPLTRGSSCGNYVSVFCEPVHGSLPIQYLWYEKTPSGDSKISDNKKMDLHCQSLKYNNYLYYCNVSNGNGTKSSEMIRVSTSNNVRNCRYVIEVNRMGKIHFCENTVTESMTTAQREKTTSPQISISPSVSGDLWSEDKVRGVVGRAVTIDCHYAPVYRSHTKYFCRMRGHQCTSLVNTNGQTEQSGRMTIRDKTSQGIFTVTMENLVFQDTGVYRCGIATSGKSLVFDVQLQVSDEPVSVPLLRFSPLTRDSSCGNYVSVFCEPVHGSLPIQYSWYEKTPSGASKISDNKKMDLHCQSLKYNNYLYYCNVSNGNGTKSSEMIRVSTSNNVRNCRYVIEVNRMGKIHFCENTVTESMTTAQREKTTSPQISISPSVSGDLWSEDKVRGVVGRAVTIDCHYAPVYRSHTKYFCRMRGHQCTSLVNTNGQTEQSGRMTIRDKTSQGIFTVTMENLVFQDTGVYRRGIATSGKSLVFDVQLQVSDEPVSVPLLRFSPLTRDSSCGNYVSVFCEPVHGSLPIQYSWYEKTPSGASKISDNKKMDLHCQSLKYNNYLYYCNVSNGNGTKSSEMIRVSTSNNVRNCRYVIEVNRMGKIHFCENTVTGSMTTAQREKTTSPQISISPSVSGDLWAEDKVRGVVGRAVTIDCHYAPMYRSHTKYFCHMRGHQCTSLVNTNEQTEQSGRMTIRDKTSQGIFTVTMENLVFQDTGVYRCGIATSGKTLVFDVYLQVSDEPVSVPLLRFSPLTRGSSCGNYVSVFCEPVHGSLPIQYSWYEKTPSGASKISDNKKMDLHCQSLKYNNYLYYCNVSNGNGTKSSEMIRVSTSNNVRNCRYVIEVNRMGKIHFCENTVTESMTTAQREKTTSPQISISPSVSGDLWSEDKVRGVVGRAVTIDCHYAPVYRSHTKYFCRMRGHQCTSLVNTNGQTEQSGRMTIRDKTSQGIFTVTMENLVFQDTGVYRCGIATSGKSLVFDVQLQVSDEPVSVPLLRFSPLTRDSSLLMVRKDSIWGFKDL
ncbi:uncharacterized protein [Hemitrygon akajei]|uniref:uncharacterized protein n=1 Tax=Hemitrygon akajei TaxID=2704970 RepID=UPI003BF98DB4